MAYDSVDKIQKVLQEEVFHYAKDSKKAAGRALGTLVEIITFYLLKNWGLTSSVSIERGLAEYGNPEIRHNVEYSLHPVFNRTQIVFPKTGNAISANSLLRKLGETAGTDISAIVKTNNQLISKEETLRNGCTIGITKNSFFLATIIGETEDLFRIEIVEQFFKPFAIFECKRVGVEEGMKKGPQTIEKAKQGAYVARTVSSLQKIRNETGELHGLIYKSDNSIYTRPYAELVKEVVFSNDAELLRRFVLTVGVVSNHGNWFTAENQNKELKVLAQSYDWLLFLTDIGLSQFIEDLILHPKVPFAAVQNAFLASYTGEKTKPQFTKVQMNLAADEALQRYFSENQEVIETWFNVISPSGQRLSELTEELLELTSKNWKTIL